MNILFYMPTVLIGGVRTVTEILSEEFRKRGHNVKWLLLYRIYGDERDFPEGESCTYLPNQDLLNNQNLAFYRDYVISNSINVIINQNGLNEGTTFIDSLNLPNVKIISVLHNNPLLGYRWIFNDAITLRNKSIIEYAKRIARILLFPRTKKRALSAIRESLDRLEAGKSIVCVLSPQYKKIVKKFNPGIKHVVAIANPNVYENPCTDHPKEKIVLFVGRLDNRSKKVNYLINCWKRIYKQNPDWKLIIVGEGRDEDILKKKAKGIKSILFAGYKNPREYYERASILCMTSLYEGFPMVITEAMQHGCVPVAFDSFPALSYMIANHQDGIIVPAFRMKEYTHSLNRLMKDDEYRFQLSRNAQTNVNRFEKALIADQWEHLFSEL